MAIEAADLIDEAGVSMNDGTLEATRAFIVSGLTGNPHARLYQAILSSGVPQYGDFHPSIPSLRVTSAMPRALDQETAKVVVTYKPWRLELQRPEPDSPPRLSIGGALVELETNRDIDGKEILLSHEFTELDADGNAVKTHIVESQPGTVRVQLPQLIFRFTRPESQRPMDKARQFLGTMNSNRFFGDPPRTWLCTRLDGDSDDGEKTWQVVYEFTRAPLTNFTGASTPQPSWDVEVRAVNPDTGELASDADQNFKDGESRKVIQLYPLADFSQLNLG